MKGLVSITFILCVLATPHLTLYGYLALIGDLNPWSAAAAVLSIPGEIVLEIVR